MEIRIGGDYRGLLLSPLGSIERGGGHYISMEGTQVQTQFRPKLSNDLYNE